MTINLLFISGVPDSGQVLLRMISGAARFVIPGSANIGAALAESLKGRPEWHVERVTLLPEGGGKRLSRPHVVFNEIAEPETHERTLQQVDQYLKKVACAVVNPPAAVRGTRRDGLAGLLSGLDGVRVPTTSRFRPGSPEDILAHWRQALPDCERVIVRGAGDHGGTSTVGFSGPGDLDRVHRLPLDGRDYLISEFVDYADRDGVFRKFRFALVGGKPVARHVIFSDRWMIHSESRDFMQARPEYRTAESEWIGEFNRGAFPELESRLGDIARRSGLDYVGLDCAVGGQGDITVFELNPAMNQLTDNQPAGTGPWPEQIERIKRALVETIKARADGHREGHG